MKFRNGLYFIVLFGITSILLFSSCKQNRPQFRGPGSNMLSTATNLPEEWANDMNLRWTYNLGGSAGWSSLVIWGNKVFIISTDPVKVNPVPERCPMPGPPSGGPAPQPVQAGQQGQNPPPGPPPQEVIDTSYLKEIFCWQVTCIDINTGKEPWKQTAYEEAPKTGKNQNSTYTCETLSPMPEYVPFSDLVRS